MENPSVGDILQLDIIGDINGAQEVMNSWQFKVLDDAGFVNQGVVDELKELVEIVLNIIDNMYSLIAIFRRFRARNITTGEATIIIELDAPHPGLLAGTAGPAGAGIMFGFRTAQKKALLKKFFSPVSTGAFAADGTLSTTTISSATSALANFLADIPTVLGNFQYGYQSPVSASWLVPTGGYVPAEPAYQRRRRFGTGS
jgi:hypothetical protein